MKFNLVNDDKLQIIISREDMAKRDIRKWDLVPHNPEAQKLFQEILDEARDACGFDVGKDAQLMIEAYPMTNESMLVTVTKMNGNKANFPFDLDTLGQALMDEMEPDEDEDLPEIVTSEAVFRFSTLEDVIQAAKLVSSQYEGANRLLRYQNDYFLALLEKEWLTDSGAAMLSEFGDNVYIAVAFFEEHGQLIVAENALEILSEL